MNISDRVGDIVAERLLYDEGYRQSKSAANEAFCDVLRQTRIELGMTQRQLANAIGFDWSYISKIENGKVEPGVPFMLAYRKLVCSY